MRSYDAIAAPPYTKGPYSWDQQLVWGVTQLIGDLSHGGNSSDELRGIVINATLAQLTPSGIAGLRVLATTTGVSPGGVGGAWADGVYGEVVEGTAASAVHATTGYISGGEFQTTMKGTWPEITAAVLTLNSNDIRTGVPATGTNSYFLIRDYGTVTNNILYNFFDAAIGSASATALVTTSGDRVQSHAIRILVGVTKMWLMCTTTAP